MRPLLFVSFAIFVLTFAAAAQGGDAAPNAAPTPQVKKAPPAETVQPEPQPGSAEEPSRAGDAPVETQVSLPIPTQDPADIFAPIFQAGQQCGGVTCGFGQYCCNPTCNLCLPFKMSCTQQACN